MPGTWNEYASDEGVLRYLEDSGPITPHVTQVTIAMESIDEALSLLSFVARSLRSTKAEFVQNVEEEKSSSASTSAQVFKILLRLQADTLAIVEDYGAGRWSEKSLAALPRYPDNVRYNP